MKRSSAAIALAISMFGSAALAQPDVRVEPSAEQKQQARDLMARGRAARADNRDKEAVRAFTAADAIMHVPPTSLELARSEIAMGLLIEAEHTLSRIHDMPVQADEPEQFRAARNDAARLQLEMPQRIPLVTLDYSDELARGESRILVDDAVVQPDSEGRLRVNPGPHRIVANAEGRRAEALLDAQEGTRPSIRLDFQASEAAPTSDPAKRSPAAPVQHAQSGVSPAVWVLGGVTVAAVGTGAVLGLLGRHRYQDLSSRCAPDCDPQSAAQVSHLYTAANASFAVGAASGIAALIVYLVAPGPTAEQAARHAPRFQLGMSLERDRSFAAVSGSF